MSPEVIITNYEVVVRAWLELNGHRLGQTAIKSPEVAPGDLPLAITTLADAA